MFLWKHIDTMFLIEQKKVSFAISTKESMSVLLKKITLFVKIMLKIPPNLREFQKGRKMPRIGPYMLYTTRNAIVSSFRNRSWLLVRCVAFSVIFETLLNLEGYFNIEFYKKSNLF